MKHLKRLAILIVITPLVLGASLLDGQRGCHEPPPLIVMAWSPGTYFESDPEYILAGLTFFLGSFDGPANEFAGVALWVNQNGWWYGVDDREFPLPAQGLYSASANLPASELWAHQWCGQKDGYVACDARYFFTTTFALRSDTTDYACTGGEPLPNWEKAPKANMGITLKGEKSSKEVTDLFGSDGLDKQRVQNEGYSYLTNVVASTQPGYLETLLANYDMRTWYHLGAHYGLTNEEVDRLYEQAEARVAEWSVCAGHEGNALRGGEAPTPEPGEFSLQNYPNPFRSSTTIAYTLPEKAPVTLTIYDMLGRKVATLVDEVQEPGPHTFTWDGMSRAERSLSAGTYVLRLSAGGETASTTITMVK